MDFTNVLILATTLFGSFSLNGVRASSATLKWANTASGCCAINLWGCGNSTGRAITLWGSGTRSTVYALFAFCT